MRGRQARISLILLSSLTVAAGIGWRAYAASDSAQATQVAEVSQSSPLPAPEVSPARDLIQQALALWDTSKRKEGMLDADVQAKALLERVVKDYPGTEEAAEALVHLGFGHWWKGMKDQAWAYYDKLFKDYPNSPARIRAWLDLDDFLSKDGRHDESISYCMKVLQAYPNDKAAAEAKMDIGHNMTWMNDYEGALKWYQRMIAENPDSEYALPARRWAGECLMWEHPKEAIPYFQEVLARESDDTQKAWALWDLATCYAELEQYDNARATYGDLLSRKGAAYEYWYASAHQNIGMSFYLQKRYAEARAELSLAITGWPQETQTVENARRILGWVDQAEKRAASGGGGS